MKIALVGAGNVANRLGPVLQGNGHDMLQVVGRSKTNAQDLAKRLNCSYSTDMSSLDPNAELVILAVNDDNIESVARRLDSNALVIHLSGNTSIDVLGALPNHGVMWPMQTFSSTGNAGIDNMGVFVEGNNLANVETLVSLAKELTGNVYNLNSQQRKQVHLAAVFANNFTNHFYGIAKHLLSEADVPFETLLPLIKSTAENMQNGSPKEMQTGPAIRGDKKVLEEHLLLLEQHPQYAKIYTLVSRSIQENK